jgi:hypothetical protein
VSGTDKKKLLVIGKSAKPRCFKGLNMDSLQVEYCANKNAWMTSEIFKKWLMRWNVELQQQSRKVLLILDNCAAHRQCSVFEKHPEGISACQHYILGAGNGYWNHKNMKMMYRGKLVNHILDAIEENLLTQPRK